MAQSLKYKVRKLAEQFNITAIISTAKEVQADLADQAVWDAMTTEEKTQWFIDHCAKYNLTVTNHALNHNKYNNRLTVDQFGHRNAHQHPYFTVFLPANSAWRGVDSDAWHLEIGSAYASPAHGEIWITAPGLKGKERQIAEVMRLRKEQNL